MIYQYPPDIEILRVYIQKFPLVGGTSRGRVSRCKMEYLYVHEYLYNKIFVSEPIKQSPFNLFTRLSGQL